MPGLLNAPIVFLLEQNTFDEEILRFALCFWCFNWELHLISKYDKCINAFDGLWNSFLPFQFEIDTLHSFSAMKILNLNF